LEKGFDRVDYEKQQGDQLNLNVNEKKKMKVFKVNKKHKCSVRHRKGKKEGGKIERKSNTKRTISSRQGV